jgi:sporulation protein YlmC with PRC-barrel domain
MVEVDFLQPEKISEVFGKQVYSTGGIFIGSVEDVEVEQESGNITGILVKLKAKVDSRKSIAIPYEFVAAIGDIAIVQENPAKLW